MITYLCRHCRRPLEVDDNLAGKIAACPHCRQVSPVPLRSTAADVPMARPAGGKIDVAQAVDEEDRGLPVDSGAEEHVLTVHPVMLRARPLHALLLFVLLIGGLAGVGYGMVNHMDFLTGIGGVAAIVGVFWGAYWKIQTRQAALVITNKRTTERRGFLRRESKEIMHDKVQELQITQSFPQRVLGIGTLGVSNASETGVEIVMEDLPNPKRIREIIDRYREVH